MCAFRLATFLLLVGGMCGGCTNHQLRVSTTRQARTLTETQYEQVLNNLAMYVVDPWVLPSLVSLKTGSTQIGDTGTLGFLGVAGLDTKFGASPTVSASRSIVDQWGNTPITDDNELKILRKAFRNARGTMDLLDLKDANDLGHELSRQIGTNSDIASDDINLQRIFDVKIATIRDNYNEYYQKGMSKPDPLPLLDLSVQGVFDVKLGAITDKSNQYSRKGTTMLEPLPVLDFIENPLCKQVDQFYQYYSANTMQDDFLEPKGNTVYFAVKGIEKLPATSLTKETARKVNDIQEELMKIASLGSAWYHVGCKKDLPDDACYAGRARACGRPCGHRFCGEEVYVWVSAEGRPALAEFTLSIISLSGMFKDTQLVTVPSGIQYSPAYSSPGR